MNLIEMALKNPQLVGQLAKQFGLGEGDTKNAIGALLPAMTRGLKKNAQSEGGLDALMGALSKGSHSRYVDEPESLAQASVAEEGNNILGHIFGDKEVSRNVAANAAQKSGVDVGILKKMLPVLAPMAMGMLSKSNGAGASSGASGLLGGVLSSVLGGSKGGQQGGAADLLGGFLDSDDDDSAMDDILSLAKKFM